MAPAALHQLFLTGLTFTAEWAARAGPVDSIVEPDGLDEEVRRYTDAFAMAAPGALVGTKALTRSAAAVDDLRSKLSELEQVSARYFTSDEGREGLAAFAEKRSPRWVG